MSKLPTPNIDSATGKGLMTALQVLITFIIGLLLAVWSVPGVPKAISDYVFNNAPGLLLSIGVPLTIGSGIISFLMNQLFRKSITTYN